MRRPHAIVVICSVSVLLCSAPGALAQTVDVTIFGGKAFPLYDERLTLQPPNPSIPGVAITAVGTPVLSADGGSVFGAAAALEFGILAIEGRIDSTVVGLEFTGVRYDLRGTAFPFQGLTASLTASPGRFDAERISLLSLNARLRTPGPIGIIASGGISYLPDIRVGGTVPLRVESPDLPGLPDFDAGLTLTAAPGTSEGRLGINGGAGLRVGGRVALIAEVRGFYFREYELRFSSVGGPEILAELLSEAAPVRFRPLIVNAQVGLTIRF